MRTVTTPTALNVAMWMLVIGLLLFGALGVRVATQRQDAVDNVRFDAGPLVAATESLYVDLADADAAASTAYLTAGLEPAHLRRRYLDDIARAGQQLTVIGSAQGLPDDARGALTQLHQQLPIYTADIDSARVNNRFGFAVGAAYQREASKVMQHELLPAATTLYEAAAHRLDDSNRSGSSRDAEAALIVAGAVVLLLLVAVHAYVTVRTKRLLNLGLLGAALIVVALCAWTTLGMRSQRVALTQSQRDGSDPMLYLSTARILALRSLSDENLDLIDRPNPDAIKDFDASTSSIAGDESQLGLLAQAQALAADAETTSRVADLGALYEEFIAAHLRVRRLAADFDYKRAIAVASTEEAATSERLDAAFERAIDASRHELETHANSAARHGRLLPLALFVGASAAAVMAAAGMWPRLKEYR